MIKTVKITLLASVLLASSLYANKIVGSLEPYATTTIKSEISGLVKKINYHIGDHVEKNELLIQVEDTDYLLEYKMAQANEKLSKINYDFLKADYERYSNLLKSKSITIQTHENRKSSYEQAQLENEISKISIKQAKRKLEKTKITAAYKGVISNRYIEVGDYVTVGDTLLELVENEKLKAVFYILQTDYEIFKVNNEVSLNIPDLKNKKIKGKVSLIAPTITKNNSGYRMEILLDNRDKKLKANFEIELLLEDNKMDK